VDVRLFIVSIKMVNTRKAVKRLSEMKESVVEKKTLNRLARKLWKKVTGRKNENKGFGR
jgi:hypothetical protein